jgi:hypothetical protein
MFFVQLLIFKILSSVARISNLKIFLSGVRLPIQLVSTEHSLCKCIGLYGLNPTAL